MPPPDLQKAIIPSSLSQTKSSRVKLADLESGSVLSDPPEADSLGVKLGNGGASTTLLIEAENVPVSQNKRRREEPVRKPEPATKKAVSSFRFARCPHFKF